MTVLISNVNKITSSFQEFKKKQSRTFNEEDKFHGGTFTSLRKRHSLPLIKRDKYSDLYDLITLIEGYTSPCVIINLFHHPGSNSGNACFLELEK